MKRTRFPAVATAASLVVMLSAAAQGCGGDEGPAAPPVPEQELLAAMEAAIQDEYHAEEVYLKVLHDFGDVLPFHNIVVAEVRHSTSIGRLFENRGWSVPTSEWNGDSVPGFATLAGACAAGVEAELANIALYDGGPSRVPEQPSAGLRGMPVARGTKPRSPTRKSFRCRP
jgi:hypothetical protein